MASAQRNPQVQMAAAWAASPRYRRLRLNDVLTPYSQKSLTYISCEEISRKVASRIFQLRVGHAPLNEYISRFKLIGYPG